MSKNTPQYIEVDGERFELVDEIDNIPLVDSFVKENKVGRGAGEARLYVGSRSKRDFEAFFGGFNRPAFFLKGDFANYLADARFEYEQQEQLYQRDIAGDWAGYHRALERMQPREFFTLSSALGEQDTARYYIRSHDPIFREYFRSSMLPNISSVSILKIKQAGGEVLFLFRPYLSYNFNPYYHPAKERQEVQDIERENIPVEQKQYLVEARRGQGEYRRKLFDESAECVITRVSDERVLIASHIKPWSVSNDQEKLDHQNGLPLTPTYDRLFDQGFISFSDEGELLVSAHLSPLNSKKLALVAGRKHALPKGERRLAYLAYHREHIFKT